jgi:branched-chain amino acid transport system permease protein
MSSRTMVAAAGVAVALALAALVPYAVEPVYVILGINIIVTALLAMSFNLLYGYAGMFSFGQAAFYGIGAYATGLILNHTSLPYIPALLLTVAVTLLAGLVLGVVLVGLDRISFIMLTFAVAELLAFGAKRLVDLTNGESGLIVTLPDSLNLVGNTNGVYYMMLAVGVVVLGLLFALSRSPFGLTLRALKENPVRVETVGVNVWRQKLIVFVLAAGVGGVAGSLSAIADQIVYPETFGWLTSANALIVTLLGGAAYFLGPVIGAIVFGLIGLYAGRATTNLALVNGLVFLAIILLAPRGITELASRVIPWIPRPRRGVEAPVDTEPGAPAEAKAT